MASETKIQWADATANWWIGCTKVASGCVHCYAESFAHRLGADVWGPGKPRRWVKSTSQNVLQLQRHAGTYDHRPRVFVSSLCDFFDDAELGVVDHAGRLLYRDATGMYTPSARAPAARPLRLADLRHAAWGTIDQCPALDFLLLTKRPEQVLPAWPGRRRDNVWLIYSASDQESLARGLPHLLGCRDLTPVLGLSLEPLIAPVDVPTVDWVIAGGESGPQARPCDLHWIRRVVQQGRAAEIPVFVKQLGHRPTDGPDRLFLDDAKGGDPEQWPPELRVREFPRI